MIYCDLDGPLVNFIGGSCAAHHRTIPDDIRPIPYDYWGPLWGMTDVQFWSQIHTAHFWSSLEIFPWFTELILILSACDPKWRVATHPHDAASAAGKMHWLRRNLPGRKFHITDCKWELSAPGRILIDDSESVVQKWDKGGGIGILFPAISNKLYRLADDPLREVKIQLRKLGYADCEEIPAQR